MYYIYHIPGIKIGCSTNPKRRVRSQGHKDYTIIEEHIDIMIASDREIELQKKYGYTRDNPQPYYKTMAMKTPESILKGGKKGGESAKKSGQLESIRSKAGKIGGKLGGKIASSIKRTCTYCKKEINGANYFRYHGEKCKLKTNI
jgi:hypothetical protein